MQPQAYEKDTSRGIRMHRDHVARTKRKTQKKNRWPELIARAYELDKGHVSGTKLSPEIFELKEKSLRYNPKKDGKHPFKVALDLIELAEKRRKNLRLH